MFAEIWPTIGPMLSGVHDQQLVMNRRGLAEETYWTYSYSPIRDEQGQVRGVFRATNDTTDRVLGERRLRTLRDLGEVSAVTASSIERASTVALEALSRNRADLPFGLIYLLNEDGHAPDWWAATGSLVRSHRQRCRRPKANTWSGRLPAPAEGGQWTVATLSGCAAAGDR